MSLLTSAPISGLAVELLRRSLVLPATVLRVPGGEYGGPSGGTITVRVPVPRTSRKQAAAGDAITYDAVAEVGVTVTVEHLYDATHITDEDLSLSLQNFGRQILMPQVAAVAEGAEDELSSAMNALTADASIEWAAAADPDADKGTVLSIREQLTTNKVPAGNRYLAVAPDIATRLLDVPTFVETDKRGSATALEAATIGTVFGLTVVESAAITAGTGIGYHGSAFALASLAPTAPGGGADSTTATEAGLSLRALLAFDVDHLQTASVVSAFAGAAVVPEDQAGTTIKRAIKVDTAAA